MLVKHLEFFHDENPMKGRRNDTVQIRVENLRMKEMGFFDDLEERLQNNLDRWEGKNRLQKGMGYYTERQITCAFTLVGMDLMGLIIWITGIDLFEDYLFVIVLFMVICFIASQIFLRYLNKRIKAQESEELAEDLEEDISRIALITVIIAIVAPLVLTGLLKECLKDLVEWIQDW